MVDREPKRKRRFFPGLVVGFVMGVAAALLAPGWLNALLPDDLRPGDVVEGHVLDKSARPERLLLKLETPQGVLLATFTERREEIDLLVEANDRVALRLPRYEPFLENPRIERVRKETSSPAADTEAASEPSTKPTEMPEDPPAPEPEPEESPEPSPPAETTTTTAPPPPTS